MRRGHLHRFIRNLSRLRGVARVVWGLMVPVVPATLWSGCATPEPPRQAQRPDVTVTLPGPHPPDLVPDSSRVVFREPFQDGPATHRPGRPDTGDALPGAAGAVAGADECGCTLEHRMNLCVTVNGSAHFSDVLAGTSFARVRRLREDGAGDTLSAADVSGGGRCFGEWRGVQRVLMLRGEAVIDSSEWFEIRTVDCCHGEARTVDFQVTR